LNYKSAALPAKLCRRII